MATDEAQQPADRDDLPEDTEQPAPDPEPDLASELSIQTGGFQPEKPSGDLVTDAQEALGENLPLDPPDEPVSG